MSVTQHPHQAERSPFEIFRLVWKAVWSVCMVVILAFLVISVVVLKAFRLVESIFWPICTVLFLAFLVVSVVGVFVVMSQPVTVQTAVFLGAVVVVTLVFVVADVVTE